MANTYLGLKRVTAKQNYSSKSMVIVTRMLIAKTGRICKYVNCDDSGISNHRQVQNNAHSFVNKTLPLPKFSSSQ